MDDPIQAVKAAWQKLELARGHSRSIAFTQYCQLILQLKQAGSLDRATAAYNIAGAMFFPEVSANPKFENITLLAGELELPDEHITGDPNERWRELEMMINEVCNKSEDR